MQRGRVVQFRAQEEHRSWRGVQVLVWGAAYSPFLFPAADLGSAQGLWELHSKRCFCHLGQLALSQCSSVFLTCKQDYSIVYVTKQ